MIERKSRLSFKIYLLLVVLISLAALLIRIEYFKKTEIINPTTADAGEYLNYGYNLRYFGTFSHGVSPTNPKPDSYRSPGYPLLIALSYIIAGDRYSINLTLFFQSFLSAALVILTFLLGRRMLPEWGAVLACIFVAVCPHLISISNCLLTETFFSLFLLLSILVFHQALLRAKIVFFILAGLIFGYTYLINETALLIPYIFMLIFFFYAKFISQRKVVKPMRFGLIIFVVVFSFFPVCWILRSIFLVSPYALDFSDRALITMSHGAYPGFIYKDPNFRYYPNLEDPIQTALKKSLRNFGQVFWERFKQRPVRYLIWYFLEKPYYLWSWDNVECRIGMEKKEGFGDVYIYPVKTSLYMNSKLADLCRKIMKIFHPIILLLALCGIPLSYIKYMRKGDKTDLAATPVFIFVIGIYMSLVHMVFAPWPRYSIPLRPELYLAAVWTFAVGGKLFQKDAPGLDKDMMVTG